LGLGVVGIGLTITCIVGLRGAHLVSLEHLLTYFWGTIIFIAPLIVSTVAAFRFSLTVASWMTHYWDQPSFASMREILCSPSETAYTKCMTPAGNESPLAWCLTNFNATDCEVSEIIIITIEKEYEH